MKITQKIILLLTVLILLVTTLIFDSKVNAYKRFNIRYENLKDSTIPVQLNNINILFFSDLHYGSLWDDETLDKLSLQIKNCSADVVLFGGDLLCDEKYNDEQIEKITQFLNDINAPLGKFAVLGEYDYKKMNLVAEIYENSEFEILKNDTIKIRNKGSQFIELVGIDSYLDNEAYAKDIFDSIQAASYTIVFAHCPDTFTLLNDKKTDYFMTGHTHGGQNNMIFKTSYEVEGATYAIAGKNKINDMYTMDITTGVGNIGSKTRFLAYPEIVLYRLKHTDIIDDEK